MTRSPLFKGQLFKSVALCAASSLILSACGTSPEAPTVVKEAQANPKAQEKKATAAEAKLTVTLPAIADGAVIPADYAFCIEDGKGKATFGPNKSPEIKWEGAPASTKSFALIAVDPKVPSKADDVNKDGKTVPASLPRVSFYHWLLADIPAATTQLTVGVEGEKVVPKGKKFGKGAHGVRGVNHYTHWFASNKDMSGKYGGYDGPCPPWNDEIVHEYHFEVYALDVSSLNLKEGFMGDDLRKAMEGHILAQGKSVGLYKLNTAVKY